MMPNKRKLIHEKSELDHKIKALEEYIKSDTSSSLAVRERSLATNQLLAMRQYSMTLGYRMTGMSGPPKPHDAPSDDGALDIQTEIQAVLRELAFATAPTGSETDLLGAVAKAGQLLNKISDGIAESNATRQNQHDSLRENIGQAISNEIGDDPQGIDWFDSREIDRLPLQSGPQSAAIEAVSDAGNGS